MKSLSFVPGANVTGTTTVVVTATDVAVDAAAAAAANSLFALHFLPF